MQTKCNDITCIKYNKPSLITYYWLTHCLLFLVQLCNILGNSRHFFQIGLNVDSTPLHTEHTAVYGVWSRESWKFPHLFDQICGQRRLDLSTTTTRSPSRKFVNINHGRLLCVVGLWRDVDHSIMYSALTRGVGVFKCVYRQTLDTFSNYYDRIYIYLALWHEFFYLCNIYIYDTIIKCCFRNHEESSDVKLHKVVQQHT